STSGLSTVAETLAAAVDAVFEHSGYQEVAATLIDREAGEQITVADRSHSLRNRTGMRRPIDDGGIGAAGAESRQLMLGPAPRSADELPRNSTLLTPVIVDDLSEAVLELYDTRPEPAGAGDL